MNFFIVNATALDTSGALSILKQFLAEIPITNNQWIIFVNSKIQLTENKEYIHLIPINNGKSLIKRFLWDTFGLKNWLKENKIRPLASLSLQNTGFRTGYKIPNFIYYHQSIPFFQQKWSLLKKEQRALWFYKYIYPFFVKLFLNNKTEIFVQLNYIREQFINKFHIQSNKVHVISPNIKVSDKKNISQIELPSNRINIFYPSTSFFYKNHSIIIEAIKQINSIKLSLYITVNKNEINSNCNFIHFMGKIPYTDVLSMYTSADVLVFPSYIETFGMPLLEAAAMGMPILVADLPYAREVLRDYEGAVFINYNQPEAWRKELIKIKKGTRYMPYKPAFKNSWPDLFKIIEDKIQII